MPSDRVLTFPDDPAFNGSLGLVELFRSARTNLRIVWLYPRVEGHFTEEPQWGTLTHALRVTEANDGLALR